MEIKIINLKCPYRKIIRHEKDKDVEEFAQCYEHNCPYFKFKIGEDVDPLCMKATHEVKDDITKYDYYYK